MFVLRETRFATCCFWPEMSRLNNRIEGPLSSLPCVRSTWMPGPRSRPSGLQRRYAIRCNQLLLPRHDRLRVWVFWFACLGRCIPCACWLGSPVVRESIAEKKNLDRTYGRQRMGLEHSLYFHCQPLRHQLLSISTLSRESPFRILGRFLNSPGTDTWVFSDTEKLVISFSWPMTSFWGVH